MHFIYLRKHTSVQDLSVTQHVLWPNLQLALSTLSIISRLLPKSRPQELTRPGHVDSQPPRNPQHPFGLPHELPSHQNHIRHRLSLPTLATLGHLDRRPRLLLHPIPLHHPPRRLWCMQIRLIHNIPRLLCLRDLMCLLWYSCSSGQSIVNKITLQVTICEIILNFIFIL